MVVVKKMPGDSDDAVIRKFSRKVIDAGIILEAKRRQFHLKPSLARKQKLEDARRTRKSMTQGAYGQR
jgi:ribosomal protein S21